MKTWLVGVAVAATLIGGCGGETDSGSTTEFDVAACEEELGDLMDALGEINSRLDIGMALSEYGERVGDVIVAYDQVDVGDLEEGCRTEVAVPAEDALQEYIVAQQRWNRCIFDQADCELSDIEVKLQDRWTAAALQLEVARSALDS